jgi:ribosomal protein S18 acetylase RimI-like enzyme
MAFEMNYHIRALTASDESIVWEMLHYAAHQPSLISIRSQPYLARYAADWGRIGDLGFVAESGEISIGAAWLRLWLGDDKGFGYVSDAIPELGIAALPDYQNQGIGTQLLMQVLNMAKGRFPAVSLSVRASNPVVRLYARFGFIKVVGSESINDAGSESFNMIFKFEDRKIEL